MKTDQQSLDDIAMLLMRYPAVSSAQGFTNPDECKVWIHFRCSDFESLKSIGSCAVAANVVITVGDPKSQLGYEAEDVSDLPFQVRIVENEQPETPPTSCQIFGVFLARDLRRRRILEDETADQLQRGWNSCPM